MSRSLFRPHPPSRQSCARAIPHPAIPVPHPRCVIPRDIIFCRWDSTYAFACLSPPERATSAPRAQHASTRSTTQLLTKSFALGCTAPASPHLLWSGCLQSWLLGPSKCQVTSVNIVFRPPIYSTLSLPAPVPRRGGRAALATLACACKTPRTSSTFLPARQRHAYALQSQHGLNDLSRIVKGYLTVSGWPCID